MKGSSNQPTSRGKHSKQTDIFRKMQQKATDNLMREMQQVLNRTVSTENDLAKWRPIQSEQKPINYRPEQKIMKKSNATRNCTPSTKTKRENLINPKHPCFRYFQHSQLIEKDSHNLADLMKRLKKLFKQHFKNAQDIKIMASKVYCMIYFQYTDENYDVIQVHLRELLKKMKNSRQKRPLFSQIYDRIFKKVAKKYHKLAVFAIQKAKDLNVKGLTKESIFSLEEGDDVMFYYGQGNEDVINFVVADRGLRFFQFSSSFVESHQDSRPNQYVLFEKCQKSLCSQQKEGIIVDMLNNQEAQSDQEDRPNYQDQPFPELKKMVFKIVNKDMSDLNGIIDKKHNEMLEEMEKDSSSVKTNKLADQHEDLTENIANFMNVRDQVISQMQNTKDNDKAAYKKILKKLIISEKQLESKLPIVAKKRKIFEMLKKQNLLIIEGETGSGKSTQLPQMLCEYYKLFDDSSARPVLVTQPRRLATRTLAERVAKEMGETVGGFVDYVASAGRHANKAAKIIFKLDRLVLDEMTEDPLLKNYSCLVIDEAHERTISIDVILGFVKDLLTKRKDFKVIVTSASMDISLFETYFKTKTLKVSGRTFPVSIIYKDYPMQSQKGKFQVIHKIYKVIDDQILFNESSMKPQYKGHLLCFCSGVDQINKLVQTYKKKLDHRFFEAHALHGKVTPADQKKAFEDSGKLKLIFASRIAETAITIDGVRVVIDPGQDIQLVYDQKFKISSMKLQEITQSSAKQRAGRSGRTAPGFCFRLYSENNFKKRITNKIPEIKNSSLQSVVLRLKTLRIHDVINFPYLEKPDIDGLKKSIDILILIGALSPKSQNVTKIGSLLVRLPIEPFLSRSIIEALIFEKVLSKPSFAAQIKDLQKSQINLALKRGISKTIIQILAMIVNFSNLFCVRVEDRQKVQQSKYNKFSDQQGDFFFLDNIYQKYAQLKSNIDSKKSDSEKKQETRLFNKWISDCFLNYRAFGNINELIGEIQKIIVDIDFNERQFCQQFDLVKAKLIKCKSFRQILLSCLITSFSANLCKFSGSLEVGYTIVNQRRPIQIYGTSCLFLLGIKSDWIICYDLFTNKEGRFFCKLAHKVDFKFMKDHINDVIWRKFDIESIEKDNPFYTQLSCELPTRFVQQIKNDFWKCETKSRFSFLRQLFPCISEETNKVIFLLQSMKKGSAQDRRKVDEKKAQLNKYLVSIRKENTKLYRHNYIGNIFINLQDGFQVASIEFNNRQFCVEIIVPNNSIVEHIEEFIGMVGSSTIQDFKSDKKVQRVLNNFRLATFKEQRKKIKAYILQEENKQRFMEFLLFLNTTYPQYQISFKQTLIDKRRKIPQTKIILHYFAGTCPNNNLLISYSLYPLNAEMQSIAEQQMDLIKAALRKKKEIGQDNYLNPQKMRLTKSKNGITVFQCAYDEYQITQELYQQEKDKLLTYKFKFPSFIKKFREPEVSEAQKDNQQWKQQIYQLFDKLKIKKENIALNIHGYYRPDRKKGEIVGQLEKILRVDMQATITTLDSTIYQKLKRAYDGQTGVLGCQKMHVRANYEQVISVPTLKAFNALQFQFSQFVEDYKTLLPLMRIETISIKTRNRWKLMIKARSPNREDFIQPQKAISSLFSPKLIKLQASEYKFLHLNTGDDILYKLQETFKWKIYFEFIRYNYSLKVYCEDSDLKNIQSSLKQEMKNAKSYTQYISYRGKNLHKVRGILERQINKNNEDESYMIQFQTRRVQITADMAKLQRIKHEILKLYEQNKGECLICEDVMRNPYKMINCNKCSFCWLCIQQYIRTFRNNIEENVLHCPNDQCKERININDVRTLLTEEQFQRICDIKINQYIEKNRDKYISCKYCENIFDKSEVQSEGLIDCEVCGKSECLRCRESHQNYTCAEWRERQNAKNSKKLGVKDCPQCKSEIKRQRNCNYVRCKQCEAHICWKCLKTFPNNRSCFDHLNQYCGGVYEL